MNDSRIGILNEDGSVNTLPSVNVLGQPYDLPATRQGIGGLYFVVLPLGGDTTAALETVKALIVPAPEIVKRKVKGADDANSD